MVLAFTKIIAKSQQIMKPPFVTTYAIQNYLSAEDGIIEAHKNNFDHWYIDASLDGEKPSNWDLHRINNMKKLCQHYQVTPVLHGNFKVPLASDVEELQATSIEYVKKEIDLAHEFNAPLIIHGGAIVEPRLIKSTKKKSLARFLLSLDQLLNYAKSKNVDIFIENLSNYKNFSPFHYIFTHPEEVAYVLDKIPEVKIFFDVGHANIGNDPIGFFTQFQKSIIGMSFSNNNGVNDQHLSLEKGKIDYIALVSEIIKANWKGMIAFETRGRNPARSINDLKKIYSIALSAMKKSA
jgi:L-ribulose-5-phosphate 3-epimerase